MKKNPHIIISIAVPLLAVLSISYGFLIQNLWNFLVVNEEPTSVDVIIVLSGDTGRVEHAVELYKSGYSDKILLTGSADTKILSQEARNLGVPASAILIENQSNTTLDNARHSLEISLTQGFKSAIVVTSPYHTRRSSIIFGQLFKRNELDLVICSVPFDSSVSRNWWKDNRTRIKVISEYFKLAWYFLFQLACNEISLKPSVYSSLQC